MYFNNSGDVNHKDPMDFFHILRFHQKNNLEDLKTHMLFALEKSNIPKRVIQEFSRSSIGTSLFSLYEFYA